MITFTFTVEKKTVSVEVPDGFEVVVTGDKISVRTSQGSLPYMYWQPQIPYQPVLPWTITYTSPLTNGGLGQ